MIYDEGKLTGNRQSSRYNRRDVRENLTGRNLVANDERPVQVLIKQDANGRQASQVFVLRYTTAWVYSSRHTSWQRWDGENRCAGLRCGGLIRISQCRGKSRRWNRSLCKRRLSVQEREARLQRDGHSRRGGSRGFLGVGRSRTWEDNDNA